MPSGGQVCPYRQRDNSSDQTGSIATGAGLLNGGIIGNAIAGFGAMLVDGFVVARPAAIISASGKIHSARKPPWVRVDGPGTIRPHARSKKHTGAVDEAPEPPLRRLNDPRAPGLLSEQEHHDRRRAIISLL